MAYYLFVFKTFQYGHTYRYSNERKDGKAYGHIKGKKGSYPKVQVSLPKTNLSLPNQIYQYKRHCFNAY